MSNCFYVSKNDGSVGTNTAYADLYDAIIAFQAEAMDMIEKETAGRWACPQGWFGVCTIDNEGGHDFIMELTESEPYGHLTYTPEAHKLAVDTACRQRHLSYEDFIEIENEQCETCTTAYDEVMAFVRSIERDKARFSQMWFKINEIAHTDPDIPVGQAVELAVAMYNQTGVGRDA